MAKNKTMTFKPSDFIRLGEKRQCKLLGERHGKLLVIDYVGVCNKQHYYLCQCDCGNKCYVSYMSLHKNSTKSCGCLKKGRKKTRFKTLQDYRIELLNNEQIKNKLKRVWEGMLGRCYNPKRDNYIYYGARGIKVCDEWRNDFMAFYKWAIENNYLYIPNQKQNTNLLSLDRINVNGNYEPSNCRFVLPDVQARNKRLPKKCSK